MIPGNSVNGIDTIAVRIGPGSTFCATVTPDIYTTKAYVCIFACHSGSRRQGLVRGFRRGNTVVLWLQS